MNQTMSRNPVKDIEELWTLEAADFLHYVVEVASPITILDHDQEILAAFAECHEEEQRLEERIIDLIVQFGGLPMRPPYDLDLGYWNFTRADLLAEKFGEMAVRDQGYLEEFAASYEGAEDLDARLVQYLIAEFITLRNDFAARAAKLVKGAASAKAAAEAAAAGQEIAVEEEEDAVTPAGDVGEDYPWHNEDLGLDERMELAKSGSLFDKLYAAMAQTDCTACGYDCEGYAKAISDGEDKDLTKCAPGELETQETLEALMK